MPIWICNLYDFLFTFLDKKIKNPIIILNFKHEKAFKSLFINNLKAHEKNAFPEKNYICTAVNYSH
jgi:hypothetical protein